MFIRSLVFMIAQSMLTVVFSIAALLTFPFQPFTRYRVITQWSRAVLWLARHVCGVQWRIIGAERIPDRASIVLSKHQSAWETLALQSVFPPQVWVLKRELLRVPFFGWGLAMMSPIAIDRRAGRRAGTIKHRVDAPTHLAEHAEHLVVDGVEHGHVEQSTAQPRLVGGHNNAIARLRQRGDGLKAARQRPPFIRALDVLVAVPVDYAIAIEDQQFHAASLEMSATWLSRRLSS